MPAQNLEHPGFTPLLIIWLLFTVPITDTTTVSINRLLKGKSPFVGGKDHTTHYLSYLGLSDRGVALVMIAITIISHLLAGLLMFHIKSPTKQELILFAIWPTLVFITLFSITKIVKPKEKKKMRNTLIIIASIILSICTIVIVKYLSNAETNKRRDNISGGFWYFICYDDRIFANSLSLTFAGENVPIEYIDVREN